MTKSQSVQAAAKRIEDRRRNERNSARANLMDAVRYCTACDAVPYRIFVIGSVIRVTFATSDEAHAVQRYVSSSQDIDTGAALISEMSYTGEERTVDLHFPLCD